MTKSIPELAAEITSVGAHKSANDVQTSVGITQPSRAPVTVDRIRQAAEKMASAPKVGSKEAQLRALREERAADAKKVHDAGSSVTYARAAERTEPANDFAKAEKATTSEESESMRTNTKAKATGKAKGASKAKKATNDRRKRPARDAAPARKAARKPQKAKTAQKTEGQTKGDTLIERLRAGWTSSKGLQAELEWQPHTLRGYLSRIAMAVKDGGKGLKVERRTGDAGSEYRITN